jgi:hypothetical protein
MLHVVRVTAAQMMFNALQAVEMLFRALSTLYHKVHYSG